MVNELDNLDSFLSANTSTTPSKKEEDTQPSQPQSSENLDIETEFSRLLSKFINGDTDETVGEFFNSSKKSNLDGLDSFLSQSSSTSTNTTSKSNQSAGGLDSFLTSQSSSNTQSSGLDSFLTSQSSSSTQSSGLDGFLTPQTSSDAPSSGLDAMITPYSSTPQQPTSSIDVDELNKELKQEEAELARAILNFKDGIIAITQRKKLKTPQTEYNDDMLKPNYKPSVGKKIAQFLLDGWDALNKYDPENMKRLNKNATDEEFLDFASSLNDTDMQLVVISYIEILINIEICETQYEQMKEVIKKNKIKKELYEEYQMLQKRRLLFIEKIKAQKFPIDAEKLINNYFKAAQKDPKGAFEALTKNPAMFTPIQFDKIKAKFFGLIKVTPEDGIKYNRKIGEFIKNLKV